MSQNAIAHTRIENNMHMYENEKKTVISPKLMHTCTHLVKSRWQRGGEIDLVVNRAAPPMMLSKLQYTESINRAVPPLMLFKL